MTMSFLHHQLIYIQRLNNVLLNKILGEKKLYGFLSSHLLIYERFPLCIPELSTTHLDMY